MSPPVKPTYWKLNYRHRRFVDALIESNFHIPTAAIKVKLSVKRGYDLKNREDIQRAIEERLDDLKSSLKMTADEAFMNITDIARDKTHKDQYKANELVLRIHGMLTDKINISMDRKELIVAVQEELKRLKESSLAEVVEAEYKLLPEKSSN
jgi:hypothetical protein